ncbi:hypothetical protein CTEN210_16164 [Chaetoceros tenuissimus]|uniref:Protein kinase domain-containing protein n=1 Tax=Chaetoceros tenuissimus TaxID=426638 RepID=A0AAD3HE58_9STRA|nr:hypothetical protein CTEN210_16164 [Chaetoceros tenuissimus]
MNKENKVSRIKRVAPHELGGILASLSLQEHNIQSCQTPQQPTKHNQDENSVPKRVNVRETSFMSPLETPSFQSPMIRKKSHQKSPESLHGKSDSSTFASQSTNRSSVNSSAAESSPLANTTTSQTTISASSTLYQEVDNDSNDEDYSQGSSEDSTNVSDEDLDSDASYIVKEDYVPYGRQVQENSDSEASCGSEQYDESEDVSEFDFGPDQDEDESIVDSVATESIVVEATILSKNDSSSCSDENDESIVVAVAIEDNDSLSLSKSRSLSLMKRSYSHMSSSESNMSSSMPSHHARQLSNTSLVSSLSSTNKVRKGKWTLGSCIGQGSFGTVYDGMNHLTGKLMAIKCMKLPSGSNTTTRELLHDIRSEITLMKSFHHVNIVRYLGCELQKDTLYVFQEWVPGGNLTSLLEKFGSFPTPVIQSYLFQILSGLQYLHEKNVLHRDIKGGNILVNDEGIVKLADFGASRTFVTDSNGILMEGEDSMANMTIRGTPYFMAPEVFQESYGRKADVWSCACVVYQMCTAHVPWRSLGIKSPVKLFMHIQNSEGLPPFSNDESENDLDIHESLLDLMKQCFERDPTKRPSVQSLLEHDFFLEHDNCEHSEVGSTLGDDSLPGASVIAGRPSFSSFSPMQLAKLKRGRVDAEVHHDRKHRDTKVQHDQSGWPSWAKNCKDSEDTNSEYANPFAS